MSELMHAACTRLTTRCLQSGMAVAALTGCAGSQLEQTVCQLAFSPQEGVQRPKSVARFCVHSPTQEAAFLQALHGALATRCVSHRLVLEQAAMDQRPPMQSSRALWPRSSTHPCLLLRRAAEAGDACPACPGLLVMAADAGYLQEVSQLLTSRSTPHLLLQGTPASPDLVRACLEQDDELASDQAWTADDLLWVQGLADSFAWCRAHAEETLGTDARQVWLCAALNRFGRCPAARISGTSTCRDCNQEEETLWSSLPMHGLLTHLPAWCKCCLRCSRVAV